VTCSKTFLSFIFIFMFCSFSPSFAQFGNPATPRQSPPFSIVLLPDTQNYAQYFSWDLYRKQTEWIANNQVDKNIRFVIHLGDMIEEDPTHWTIARDAHNVLSNAGIPYSPLLGNHDYDDLSSRDSRSYNKNEHFGVANFLGNSNYEGYGHMGSNNDTAYYLFSPDQYQKWMVVALEFAPSKDQLCWANNVIKNNPARRVIIATHCYNFPSGNLASCAKSYDLYGSDGHDIWNELASRHNNVFAVVAGHFTGSVHTERTGNNRNIVHEFLTDYQNEPLGGTGYRLGNGWLKWLTIFPHENLVKVFTNTVEPNNSSIFPVGPRFYLTHVYNSDPVHADHVFEFRHDLASPIAYQYDDKKTREFAEREISGSSPGNQKQPSVARSIDGISVVVWNDDRDGNGIGNIYARGFDREGCELFPEFMVHAAASGDQAQPSVAINQTGAWVVAWSDDSDGNGVHQIKAKRFNANGQAVFSQITVNQDAFGDQQDPKVALADDGEFVVVWRDTANNQNHIEARRFNAAGDPLSSDILVSGTSPEARNPAVSMNQQTGDFLTVWEDDANQNQIYEVKMRGFSSGGAERIPLTTVNTNSAGQQVNPAVAVNNSGDFVVVWQDDVDNNGSYNIRGRGFNAAGVQTVTERTVNQYLTGDQKFPVVATNRDGSFVVAWEGNRIPTAQTQNTPPDHKDIFARTFYRDGSPRDAADITLSRVSTGEQTAPAIATDGSKNYLVVAEDDRDRDGRPRITGVGRAF